MPFRENLYYLLQDNKPIVTENLSAQEWKPVEVWDNQVNLPTELIKQLEDKQSEQEEVNEAIDSVNMGLESADVSTSEEIEEQTNLEIIGNTVLVEENTIEEVSMSIEEPVSHSLPNESLLSFDEWIALYRSDNKVENVTQTQTQQEVQSLEKSLISSQAKDEKELEDWSELNKLIQTSSPYDLFGLEKDLTERQVESVNRFIGNEINRKKQKKNLQDNEGLPADELITETLAKLYWKQGKHNKSIAAFKRLALKFPEKSAYFASLISEIEKSSK